MNKILVNISKEKPIGEAYQYNDDYMSIEVEIDKSLSGISTEKIDWGLIHNNTRKILEENSKDLKILTYWIYASWKINNWEGIKETLPIYEKFLKKYSNAHPKSLKIKQRTVEWLRDNLIIGLIDNYNSKYKKFIEEIITRLKSIDIILNSILKDEELCIFKKLIIKLENIDEIDKKIVQKEKEIQVKKELTEISEEPTELYALKNTIQSYVSDEYSPNHIAFILHLGLEELSIHVKQKIIPEGLFPLKQDQDKIKKIHQEKDVKRLPLLIEQLIKYPSWLEGYFMLLEIVPEKKEIELFKIAFLTYLEEYNIVLIEKSSKNYKIISEQMLIWLEKERKTLLQKDSQKSFYEIEYEKSLIISKEKSLQNGIQYLTTYYDNSLDGESSFIWRLKQASLALEVGNKEISLALLLDLNERIEKYKLDIWKPNLALEVYKMILKPILARELSSEKKEYLYQKLCMISIDEAILIDFI